MVERWNIGFIVNPAGGGTINPTLHYPRAHYSIIPIVSEANQLESIGISFFEDTDEQGLP